MGGATARWHGAVSFDLRSDEGQKERWELAISRVLSWATIHLGPASPQASSSLPGGDAGRIMPPYLALLRVGFTMPRRVTTRAVRSYRTLSPLPVPGEAIGGLLSAALSVGSRPPGVTWHPALWSPDFPQRHQRTAIAWPTPASSMPIFHFLWERISRYHVLLSPPSIRAAILAAARGGNSAARTASKSSRPTDS